MPHLIFALFLFLAKSEELDASKRELEVLIEEGRKKSERDITEAKRKRRNSRQRAVKLRAKAVAKYQSKVKEKNAALLVAMKALVKSNDAFGNTVRPAPQSPWSVPSRCALRNRAFLRAF